METLHSVKTSKLVALALLIVIVVVSACAAQAPDANKAVQTTPSQDTAQALKLKIGVSPLPHAELVNFVKEKLAPEANLEIEIVEFTDYVQPNLALQDGQLDANFFQHAPYLEDFNTQHNTHLVSVGTVHIEPLGIYSSKIKNLSELKEGDVVAIPNDATNAGRALNLLAQNKLITLKDGAGFSATVDDVTDNPLKLKITELDAAQLVRSLEDTSIAVINGNYALEGKLVPAKDALALESSTNNPYANIVAVKQDHENDPAIQLFMKLITSDEVKQFIESNYQGSVIPAFGSNASSSK